MCLSYTFDAPTLLYVCNIMLKCDLTICDYALPLYTMCVGTLVGGWWIQFEKSLICLPLFVCFFLSRLVKNTTRQKIPVEKDVRPHQTPVVPQLLRLIGNVPMCSG